MLSEEMTGRLVNEIRRFLIADAATLSKANDEQLRRRIADIIDHKLVNYRISPQERSRIVRLVFSSIRGMGILDEILADDSITEIMINGPFHIFVERAGRLEALNKKFASENELRNIIQKMVGSVGKEVNEANPIVDTRLADGSRVNVVLPPLSLSGPIVTIRKFSRTPMTVDQLLKYGSITRFFRNYPFLDFPTYLSFASNNCFLQRPYIVRFIIFNRLFVPSTKPLL